LAEWAKEQGWVVIDSDDYLEKSDFRTKFMQIIKDNQGATWSYIMNAESRLFNDYVLEFKDWLEKQIVPDAPGGNKELILRS